MNTSTIFFIIKIIISLPIGIENAADGIEMFENVVAFRIKTEDIPRKKRKKTTITAIKYDEDPNVKLTSIRAKFTNVSISVSRKRRSDLFRKRREMDKRENLGLETETPKKRKEVSFEKLKNCSHCGGEFSSFTLYESHFREKHPQERPYTCNACNTGYRQKSSFLRHLRRERAISHKGNVAGSVFVANCLNCVHCNGSFRDRVALSRHEGTCEKRKFETSKDRLVSLERPKFCEECNEHFPSYNQFELHCQERHPRRKIIFCEDCQWGFACRANLRQHIRHVHRKISLSGKMKARYRCPYCGQILVGITKFEEHGALRHPGMKLFNCGKCSDGFVRKYTLERHEKDVHSEGDLLCEGCGDSYGRKDLLERHRRFCIGNNVGGKGKRFERQDFVASPRQCPVCRKILHPVCDAKFQAHVRKHQQTNMCPVCKKQFDRNKHPSILESHVSRRHNLKGHVDALLGMRKARIKVEY